MTYQRSVSAAYKARVAARRDPGPGAPSRSPAGGPAAPRRTVRRTVITRRRPRRRTRTRRSDDRRTPGPGPGMIRSAWQIPESLRRRRDSADYSALMMPPCHDVWEILSD
eukprot:755915-Hanusia_phi.AAC.1